MSDEMRSCFSCRYRKPDGVMQDGTDQSAIAGHRCASGVNLDNKPDEWDGSECRRWEEK